jgi:ribosomal protein S17
MIKIWPVPNEVRCQAVHTSHVVKEKPKGRDMRVRTVGVVDLAQRTKTMSLQRVVLHNALRSYVRRVSKIGAHNFEAFAWS